MDATTPPRDRVTRRLHRRRTLGLALALLIGCDSTPEVVGLLVEAPAPRLETRMYLLASAFYSDGSERDVTGAAEWRSSDEATATVAAGIVTRVGPGQVVVSATLDGFRAEVVLDGP